MNTKHLIDGVIKLAALYPGTVWSADEERVYGPVIPGYKDYEDTAPDHVIGDDANLYLRTIGWWIDDGQWIFYV